MKGNTKRSTKMINKFIETTVNVLSNNFAKLREEVYKFQNKIYTMMLTGKISNNEYQYLYCTSKGYLTTK